MNVRISAKTQMRQQSDERIIRAAIKVFGSVGYGRATMSQVAEEAGVSQGLVSQRFHSKEELLQIAFDQTRILSFYDEESQHLPQAFYILLNHLKQEVEDAPELFSFLNMIHTGIDTPKSFEEHTKKVFSSTPLYSAVVEAQEQNDLPAGDPWDIFRVFFRNATNLIGWYHQFGMPIPENDYFLYAIQYNRRQKETEATLKKQKYKIHELKTDRDILFTAVSDIYPLIIFSNLTQNSYYMLEYDHYTTRRAKESGVYDELIRVGASTIPNEIHREQFSRLFDRNNVICAYRDGKQQLFLRHLQVGDDGITRWIETRMLFKGCECGEIQTITLAKHIDNDMERLLSYGEALQNAEIAARTKSRFLSNLSHQVRTPMNAIMGYSALLARRTYDTDKVQDYAKKMLTSSQVLMDLLAKALDAANLSIGGNGIDIRININESCGGIISNAVKLATLRGVKLNYKIGSMHDYFIYADEIRIQRCIMTLILLAINRCAPGGCVNVELKQLPDPQAGMVQLQFSVQDNGVEIDTELLHQIIDDSPEAAGIVIDLDQIRDDIQAMGGTIDIHSNDEGNTVVCILNFRREK